jgi:hypothetical protein
MEHSFSKFVDKAFWAILCGLASFSTKFIHDLSESVSRMEVGIVRLESSVDRMHDNLTVALDNDKIQEQGISDLQRRVSKIEGRCKQTMVQ